MSGLFHTLGIGSESLFVSRQGVDTTGHNISNAQQPGYSRQRLNLATRDPLQRAMITIGNGTYVREIARIHDQFVENQLNLSAHDLGASQTKAEALKGLEGIYSPELQATVQDELNSFFSAVRDFSNNPEEVSVRTNLREAAGGVASSFRRVDMSLRRAREDVNDQVAGEAKDVNEMLRSIASLNLKIGELESGANGPANDMRDQRDKIVRDLSQKMEVRYYEDKFGGFVIRGPGETSLVEGKQHATIDVDRGAEGMYEVTVSDFENRHSKGLNEYVEKGKLRALLDVRDKTLPGLIDHNNGLATTFVENVNNVHSQGFGLGDFKEVSGRGMFKDVGDPRFAAQDIGITDAITASTDALSGASSPNAPGDNVIANDIIRLQSEKLFDDGHATLSEYYSNFVSSLGLEIQRADHTKEANEVIFGELNAKREAVSGVSLDEEATNLLKWQTCFRASSKLITTVDEMLDTVLSLKR